MHEGAVLEMKFLYYYINDYLKPSEIKKINSTFNKKSEKFTEQAPTLKTSKAVQMPYEEFKKIKDVNYDILTINRAAYGFDIYESINDWVAQNTYKSTNKGEYQWHTDGGEYDKKFTTKLTTLINLSEKAYSGGKFLLFNNQPVEIKELNKPGSLVVFPSFILHQITPVTRGTRISATLFKTGRWWQ
jgi:predicted 2-oxoglutarate/Fe(II)-dependent dioxygenase YbiX